MSSGCVILYKGILCLTHEQEDDVITSISLYNRFWSPTRFVEETNKQ